MDRIMKNPIKRLESNTIDRMCELTEKYCPDRDEMKDYLRELSVLEEMEKMGKVKEYVKGLPSLNPRDYIEVGAYLCEQGFEESKPIYMNDYEHGHLHGATLFNHCYGEGLSAVGMFHTHPLAPAYPSPVDVEQFGFKFELDEDIEPIMCIGGRNSQNEPEVNCFVPKDESYVKEGLNIREFMDTLKNVEKFVVFNDGKHDTIWAVPAQDTLEDFERRLKEWFDNHYITEKYEC